MIRAQNIYKSIGKSEILKDVSLELKKGTLNVLFGPSGSGKTTLCRNLSLLDYPDKGSIGIFDNTYLFPLKEKIKKLPYPKIGFVYQQLFLWPHLTNRENIMLALSDSELFHKKQISELAHFLEIENILDRYPNEISLGQRQRIAIARTLILNPDFVFLDEITSALDIVQTKKIVQLLLTLKEKGIGLLLITHNLEYIKEYADNFIFLKDGKIVETGNSILTNPKTSDLKEFIKI
jgi:ABC-type polar amino acid transport system ATPase subunit